MALQDRLEVRLHLASGHLDEDRERQARAPPGTSPISGPTTRIRPSSTWSIGRLTRYSKARLYLPPNSIARSSLRTRSPSKAGPWRTGIGISTVWILTPRTSTARAGMSLWLTFETTCS